MKSPVAILNTSILTAFGDYHYCRIDLEDARQWASGETVSAVGHESTAQILTTLLRRDVPVNRIQYEQPTGASAIVFKLRGRPPEGKVLSVEEVEAIGYDFGLLTRTG